MCLSADNFALLLRLKSLSVRRNAITSITESYVLCLLLASGFVLAAWAFDTSFDKL